LDNLCSPVCPPCGQALRGVLWDEVFLRVRLWEFLQVNVEKAVEQFQKLLHSGQDRNTPPLRLNASYIHYPIHNGSHYILYYTIFLITEGNAAIPFTRIIIKNGSISHCNNEK